MDQELLSSVIGAIVYQKHNRSMLVGDDALRWMTGGGLSHVTVDTATGDRWGFDEDGVHLLDELTTKLLKEEAGRGRGARGMQLKGALATLIIQRFRALGFRPNQWLEGL